MLNNFGLLDLSTADMVIILAIVLLLFGSKKLPGLARSLGSSARELKTGFSEASEATRELKQQVAGAATAPQTAAVEGGQPVNESVPIAPAQQKPAQFAGLGSRRIIQ